MLNHIHLVAVPPDLKSLGVALRSAHGTYADYFNTKHEQVGHLWGERYFSSVLDEAYLWNAIRYVEQNPVRAGLVERAEDYEWSSAAAHCGLRRDSLLSEDCPLLPAISDWSSWLRDEVPPEQISFLREKTHSGRPCGNDDFVRSVGSQLGRTIQLAKPGPKGRKAAESEAPSLFRDSGIE
jgi:putative transposase